MSLRKSEKDMLARIAKEIASEIIERKKDPEYSFSLDKTDCIKKLVSITNLEYNEISEMLERNIEKYIRMENIF